MRSLLGAIAALSLFSAVPAMAAGPHGLPPAAPYLQNGQAGQMTIVWRSEKPRPAVVRVWDETGRLHCEQPHPAAPQVEAVVTGLVPGGHYRYTVEEAGQVLGTGRFVATRTRQGGHLRFAAFGDMGSGNADQRAIADAVTAWKPELVVATGDIVYPAGEGPLYGPRFFTPYQKLLADAPIYPSLGNHDYGTDAGAPYLAAFSLPPAPGGERYYAFDAGPARFWVLDSMADLGPGSPQRRWLEEDARKSDAPWKFAVFHHPPYSSGIHGSAVHTRALAPVFSRLGFAVVFTGHDHHYERSKPQGGVTYVVTGGGGAIVYGMSPKAHTEVAAPVHHFVTVTISGRTLAAKAVTANGQVIDSWTLVRPPAHRGHI